MKRTMIRALPEWIRLRLVTRLARQMVRSTYGGSRAVVRWRRGRASVDIRGSIFCEVREKAEHPLCEFYASAIRRLMYLFNLDVDVDTEKCRATGGGQCVMALLIRPTGVAG
jgi:predicted hydrocarbon binding protein